MLRRRSVPLVLALAAAAAGCGTPPPSPGTIAENYVNAIASGDYAGACSILSVRARRALRTAMGSSASCQTLLARCLPTQETVLKKDQVQLYYANVDARVSGSHAIVATSGTAVANRVKQVTLLQRQGTWHLSSYGEEKCHPSGHRR